MVRVQQLSLSSLVALALITGCAPTVQYEWVKAGVTDEQRETDRTACLFDSKETVYGVGRPRRVLDQDRYQRCLEGLGYERKEVATAPSR